MNFNFVVKLLNTADFVMCISLGLKLLCRIANKATVSTIAKFSGILRDKTFKKEFLKFEKRM